MGRAAPAGGSPHRSSREYAADAYAASLGQGEDLARHLADFEQPLDFPRRRFPLDLAEHPPVALRIERLTAAELLALPAPRRYPGCPLRPRITKAERAPAFQAADVMLSV